MSTNEHVSGWFRDEFRALQEEGKTGNELKVAMYEKGISYLEHVVNNSTHWNAKNKDVKDVLEMIKFSQAWCK